MKIADVMTRDVRVIQPDRTVRDAARLMDEMNVGVLPVCDGRRLVGMITDRDIAIRGVAGGGNAAGMKIREAMTNEVRYCFDDEDTATVAEKMAGWQVRRLPVLNRDKRLVGIVSLGDLAIGDQGEAPHRALKGVSEGAHAGEKPGLSARDLAKGGF
jgi:CBS domain-containing protein